MSKSTVVRKFNISGRVFDQAKVIRVTKKRDKSNSPLWECKCLRCKKEFLASGAQLRAGHVKSCGCLRRALRYTKEGTLRALKRAEEIFEDGDYWFPLRKAAKYAKESKTTLLIWAGLLEGSERKTCPWIGKSLVTRPMKSVNGRTVTHWSKKSLDEAIMARANARLIPEVHGYVHFKDTAIKLGYSHTALRALLKKEKVKLKRVTGKWGKDGRPGRRSYVPQWFVDKYEGTQEDRPRNRVQKAIQEGKDIVAELMEPGYRKSTELTSEARSRGVSSKNISRATKFHRLKRKKLGNGPWYWIKPGQKWPPDFSREECEQFAAADQDISHSRGSAIMPSAASTGTAQSNQTRFNDFPVKVTNSLLDAVPVFIVQRPSGGSEGRRPQYVTLDQAAAMVQRAKRTLRRLKDDPNSTMPSPDVEGGGGKPDEWRWERLRPWLAQQFSKELPEDFPY
jgi:hypothetical protein